MKKRLLFTAAIMALTGSFATLHAQDEAKPKFKFTPSGRILLDGAVFGPEHKAGFADGIALPDIRVGGKAEYGNWLAKIDVGYAFGKIGMKDVYIQYKFNPTNLLRGGYFVHQFGLQSATSSSFKETFEAPITDTYMNATGRNMGFMYLHYGDKFLASASGIIGTKLTERANDAGKVSLGVMSRLLWHPVTKEGKVAQVGVSGWYQSSYHSGTKEADGSLKVSPGFFNYSADYPTRVDNVTLVSTNIDNARGVFKLSPEFQLAYDRFALAGQYYYMNVNRKDGMKHFQAQGAYGVFRALLFGDTSYGYSDVDGGLALPKPKTLECVLSYNYTNASDKNAMIWGGITNDYSVTLNYYINKYMLCRLRWSYTNLRNSADLPRNHVNIVEARVQFKF